MKTEDTYDNWDMSALPKNKTFPASITKIDALLSGDPMRWCLTAADREVNETDWKPERVAKNRAKIKQGEPIAPPEFYIRGSIASIMNGRHRIYAFHEEGYEYIHVQCNQEDLDRLQVLIGR